MERANEMEWGTAEGNGEEGKRTENSYGHEDAPILANRKSVEEENKRKVKAEHKVLMFQKVRSFHFLCWSSRP